MSPAYLSHRLSRRSSSRPHAHVGLDTTIMSGSSPPSVAASQVWPSTPGGLGNARAHAHSRRLNFSPIKALASNDLLLDQTRGNETFRRTGYQSCTTSPALLLRLNAMQRFADRASVAALESDSADSESRRRKLRSLCPLFGPPKPWVRRWRSCPGRG